MTNSSLPEPMVPENPFQSPIELEASQATHPNSPNGTLLGICLVVVSIVNLAASGPVYLNQDYSLAVRLSWVIPDLFFGLAYSLGLAMLIHTAWYRQWSTLMPGHWRLIAFLSSWFIYAGSFAPSLGALVAYAIFIATTNERRAWKSYAWACVVIYFFEFVQMATVLFFSDIFLGAEDPTAAGANIFGSPWFIAFLAVSLFTQVGNLAALVLLIVGMITDAQHKVRRDFYHYLGIGLVMVLPIAKVIWTLVVGGMLFPGASWEDV